MIDQNVRTGFIQQHLRRNFLTNLAQDSFCYFGYGFISFETFLPIYISQFTTSKLLIGLVAASVSVGWLLPQLFVAPWVERMARKKPFVVRMAFIEKLFYLVLAGLAFIALQIPPAWLVVFFVMVCLSMGITGGMTLIGWEELIASIFPSGVRGQYFGVSFFVGGLLGALGATLGGTILDRFPFPQNYALTFAAGFLLIIFGWNFLLWIREPVPEAAAPTTQFGFTGDLVDLLKRDPAFRAFLAAQSVVVLGGMAYYFMSVFGKEKLSLDGTQIGLLATFFLVGKTTASLLFGWLGDQIGHRKILAASTLFQILGFLLAIRAGSIIFFYAAVFLIGMGRASASVNAMPLIFKYAPVQRRPTYIGLASTSFGLVTILAPLLGGAFAQGFGYAALFGLSVAIMLVALGLYFKFVKDPVDNP
jgi:MFS family permease